MNIREQLNSIIISESKNSTKYIIAKHILKNITLKKYPTINSVSKDCFVSKSSIVRFCQNLGLEGYKEFILKIKFEDEKNYNYNFLKTEAKSEYLDDFIGLQDIMIENIKNSQKLLPKLIRIKDFIMQSNKIYIFSSYELEISSSVLYDYLSVLNLNVVYIKDKKTSSFVIDYLDPENLCIFLVGGVNNSYLKQMWDYISNKKDRILFTSKSQKSKFKGASEFIELDFYENLMGLHNKEIELLYIFKQILVMLINNSDAMKSFNSAHRF